MLFTIVMGKRLGFIFSSVVVIVISAGFFSCSNKDDDNFSERVKVSLRKVGHQLLLKNQDSTSLVDPIIELRATKFQLSFQKGLFLEPDSLVSIVQQSFQESGLPSNYRVEVLQCAKQEVVYSYEVNNAEDQNIIPCRGRNLPESCYVISVRFIKSNTTIISKQVLLLLLLIGAFILLGLIFYRKNKAKKATNFTANYSTIGSFKFYPEQNKLIMAATEINLSKKECELLAIFIAQPNQVIKRDELTKRVWEDNGVIVGRSLDTYISKLRKKLKDDSSIKLTNIHGIGYKLEF